MRQRFVRTGIFSFGMMAVGLPLSVGLGCKDLTGAQQLPAGTSDPASYNTPAGAMEQRNAAMNAFITLLPRFVEDVGEISDEFVAIPCLGGCFGEDLDQRQLREGTADVAVMNGSDARYSALHGVRGLAGQAISQLATYAPASPPAVRGELFAVEGYAEIFLADMFCSGVPLSTLDFQKDYTYQPSSTTAQVYQHAIVLFDSALAISGDSARIMNLARIGKGRALLNLGEYALAAQAVTEVPGPYRYQMLVGWYGTNQSQFFVNTIKEADREGGNGLAFVLSGDPRSAAQQVPDRDGDLFPLPTKIVSLVNAAGFAPLTIADGTEARLIQAEAALRAGDPTTWLLLLNRLRATALVPGEEQADPQHLPQLTMPSTDSARIALMFSERAEWLFATAHRQGDLRRQLRQDKNYWPNQNTLYPVGMYPNGGFYGNNVTAPIPAAEFTNPLYHGCLDRNA